MSDMLAIQWERTRVCLLDAQVQRGSVRVRRGLSLSWPEGIAPGQQPKPAGEWLAAELRKAGIEGRRAVVALPREDCVIRRLDLPDAPDDELPDLVRMQAATVSSTAVERLALDFVPLPRVADAPGRTVLMATVFRERLDGVRTTLEAAGIEIESAGLSAVGAAEAAARHEQRQGVARDGASLVVCCHERRVEFVVVSDHRLVMAHSTDLAGESVSQDQQRLLAELGRSLVSLDSLGVGRIARAWTVGATAPLRAALTERFGVPAEEFDPLTDTGVLTTAGPVPKDLADFAGPAGALMAMSGGLVERIDFLSPRKPPEKKDRRRQRALAAAAAIVALAAAGYWKVHSVSADLDAQIVALKNEMGQLDKTIKDDQPTMASAKALEEWNERRVDWLGQLRQVGNLLPGTSRIYLTDLRAALSTNDAVARLRATGYARDRRDVEILSQRMRDENYRVRPQETRYSDHDSEYPWRFESDLDLLVPSKTKPAAPK